MFQLPTVFHKELALSSQKVYTRMLNNLAVLGFDTVDKLKKTKDVIKGIKQLTENHTDPEKGKTLARYYISSIFWVLKLPAKNAYYTFYQKNLPAKAGDKAWLPKKDFDNAS